MNIAFMNPMPPARQALAATFLCAATLVAPMGQGTNPTPADSPEPTPAYAELQWVKIDGAPQPGSSEPHLYVRLIVVGGSVVLPESHVE